ncbi:MAG: hypothetical protein Q7S65_02750 [Nanoarchaeota archaeon]|nr:hypothetical protein [Nanoarchaeota archaeon]
MIREAEQKGRAALNIQKENKEKGVRGKRQLFVLSHAVGGETLERVIQKRYADVLFDATLCSIVEECHLVFRRKFDRNTSLPELWLMAGRHGEESCFNAFSSPKSGSGNPNFVTLLFSSKVKPGFTGFKPLYVKVQVAGEYHYFKIDAESNSDGGLRDLLVKACLVPEAEAPQPLQEAIALRQLQSRIE